MSGFDRHLQLAGAAPDVMDVVAGLANATSAVLYKDPKVRAAHARKQAAAKEIASAYQTIVYALAGAALEYRPDMSEAQLRAWAAQVSEALR